MGILELLYLIFVQFEKKSFEFKFASEWTHDSPWDLIVCIFFVFGHMHNWRPNFQTTWFKPQFLAPGTKSMPHLKRLRYVQ